MLKVMWRIFALILTIFIFGCAAKKEIIKQEEVYKRPFKIFDTKTGEEISIESLAFRTTKADVIFFGEFHDDEIIHEIQDRYLKFVYDRKRNVAVSFEMFERDVQPFIDDYLSGKIDEEKFLEKSRPWYDYKKFYRPLLETAKSNSARVIAANIPRMYAGMYTKGGMSAINKLDDKNRSYISETLNLKKNDYKDKFFSQMMKNMGIDEKDLNYNQENSLYLFYGAQSLKDETMAESINDFITSNKGYKVVHFNGDFHSAENLGTVEKLRDRNPYVNISVITPVYAENSSDMKFSNSYTSKGDFVIVLEDFKRDFDMSMMKGHLSKNYINRHEIDIEIKPDEYFLKGKDIITFNNPIIEKGSIELLKTLDIINIQSPNNSKFEYKIEEGEFYNEIIIEALDSEVNTLEITYRGNVYFPVTERKLNEQHQNSLGMISGNEGEGIYLPAGSFYPYTDDDLADFNVKVTIPSEFVVVTSGKINDMKIRNNQKIYEFETEVVADNLTLVGGKYKVYKKEHDGVNFGIYTLTDLDNSDTYFDAIFKYHDMYKELFGEYPYSNFNMVENFFNTGYGMPGYTLIAKAFFRMPWLFLSEGSLGHEFVHNWWGNSVYVNHNFGNWCEALTTFCANYYYAEVTDKEKAEQWRRNAMLKINNIPDDKNYPLSEFKYQENDDDAVIGYDKGSMVFYEVYKLMGKDHFFGALKEFYKNYKGKRASWFSIIRTFDMYAKMNNLEITPSTILNTYLKSTELPEYSVKKAEFMGETLYFEIDQVGLQLPASIPFTVETRGGDIVDSTMTFYNDSTKFELDLFDYPTTITIDKNAGLLRKLNEWEVPFVLDNTLNDNPVIILPSRGSTFYSDCSEFVDMLLKSGYKFDFYPADEMIAKELENRSVLILGDYFNNPYYENFSDNLDKYVDYGRGLLKSDDKEFDLSGKIAMINTTQKNGKDLTAIYFNKLDSSSQFRRLLHYKGNSYVILNQYAHGKAVYKEYIYPELPDKSPLIWKFE